MSVDFAIFDPAFAPRDGKAFRTWYQSETDWDIDVPYIEPEALTPPLLEWYRAMTKRFPDLIRSDAEGVEAIDYCFTAQFMYCSMASSSHANDAWKRGKELAATHNLGSYDCMSDDGRDNRCIVFPDGPLANEPSLLSRIFQKIQGVIK